MCGCGRPFPLFPIHHAQICGNVLRMDGIISPCYNSHFRFAIGLKITIFGPFRSEHNLKLNSKPPSAVAADIVCRDMHPGWRRFVFTQDEDNNTDDGYFGTKGEE